MFDGSLLEDPLLTTLAKQVDDLEQMRIANGHRVRLMTTDAVDKNGVVRGLNLPEDNPDVQRVMAIMKSMEAVEAEAIKHVQKYMRNSKWGTWLKQARGVGEKQLARLLGEIGDPYWNSRIDLNRPRTVSELWAYCGLHTIPAPPIEGQTPLAVDSVTAEVRIAPKRRKGVQSNWSEAARKRAWLIATSCVKAPPDTKYRMIYDDARVKYEEAVHSYPCAQCGTKEVGAKKATPAAVGSPLRLGHQHARGLRAIAKAVLQDLWIEARKQHEAAEAEANQPA